MEKQNMQLDLGEVITLSIILIFRNVLFLCFLSLSIPFFSVSVCPYSSICLAHHFRLAVCQSLLVSSDFFFLLIFTLSPTFLLPNYIFSYGQYLCFASVFFLFFFFFFFFFLYVSAFFLFLSAAIFASLYPLNHNSIIFFLPFLFSCNLL
jgi:hypothetical protein